jgi:hypothetical protein
MIRVRTELKIEGEIFEHWSASKHKRLQNSYITPGHGGF